MSQIVPHMYSLSSLLTDDDAPDYTVAFSSAGDKSWNQFCSDIKNLSAVLIHYPEHRWAICANDSYLFAVALMALCHSNKDIILPGNHQSGALAELSPHFDAILYDSAITPPDSVTEVNLEQIEKQNVVNTLFTTLDLDKINITLFTSGSSGVPKAIHKTLRHFEEELIQHHQMWGNLVSGTQIYSTVSHQHVYGLLFRLLFPLMTKRSFDRYNLLYPEQVFEHAADDAVLISSPALLKRLAENAIVLNKNKVFGHYRAIYSSGGPLTFDAAQDSKRLLGSLPFEVFGSTETGGIGFRQQESESSIWTLFPKVTARLDNAGCIALFSPHIDQNNWYQTEDQCSLIDERHFILLGRADKVVKIEEKRVSLLEVEKRLLELDEIDDGAVIVLSQSNRLVLSAILVLSPVGLESMHSLGKGAFWIQLRQQLRTWLEPVAVPKRFRFVDDIPVNSQGKRQLVELQKLFDED